MFCIVDPRFISMYAVYYYYRTHKWIPKSGLKYGADFVLYNSSGVPLQHAQYAVIVKNNGSTSPQKERLLSWAMLSHVTRLAEHVAKGTILCHIARPTTLHMNALSPSSLLQLEVIETVLDRWQPAQTR